MSNTIISVVAALIRDPDGRVLLVRKRGTEAAVRATDARPRAAAGALTPIGGCIGALDD